jgi:hypothetical protein
MKKFVSLADIKKSLNRLNETSCDLQCLPCDLKDKELTRSFFEWIVESEYDLTTAMHQADAWVNQDDQKKTYIQRFIDGELNHFLTLQTWAEQIEDGDD